MPRPLPVALRQRVVDAHNNGEGTYAELAERFSVGEASVSRWLRKAREGDLTPGVRGPMAPEQRMLKPEHLEFLRETLEAIPDSTGAELAAALDKSPWSRAWSFSLESWWGCLARRRVMVRPDLAP